MRIRPAEPADATSIAAVHTAGWRFAYANILPAEFLDRIDPAQCAARWRDTLRELVSPAFVLVAEADGIVGFAHLGPSRDSDRPTSGELYAIYVDPGVTGTGAGKSLLNSGEHALIEKGFIDAILWVLERNAPAREFYEHFGWTAEATTKKAVIGGARVTERRYGKALV